MARRGLIISDSRRSYRKTRNYCEFYHDEGHEIQECVEFRALVQGMMDNKEMEFCEEIKEERSICTMLGNVHINVIYEDTKRRWQEEGLWVQGMMDNKEMEFCEEIKEERSICTMLGNVHINVIYEDTTKKGPC
ncbi:hypothetical protein GOBAR_DD28782 [Gossypium barbadense]|nr:hypothetical protein GOBAR_DD28782 [Gossypium barbadense]